MYLILLLVVVAIILGFNYSIANSIDVWFADLLEGNEFLGYFHFLGDERFAIIAVIIMVGIVLYKKLGYKIVLFILGNYGLMLVINRVLKYIIQRPRPEAIDQLASYSMPSGHTMASLTFALVTAYLWKTYLGKYTSVISILLIVSAVLCGLSRIADARHFFTDVFVGWILSYAIYYFMKKWYEKGRIE